MTQNNMATNLIKLGSGDINHPKYSFKAKGLDLAVYKNLFTHYVFMGRKGLDSITK